MEQSRSKAAEKLADIQARARLHLRVGWWSLLLFLTLGIVLEGLHGLKIGWYLDVSNETRRLMWTLAHAHGTLLSLIHVAFGLTVTRLPNWPPRPRLLASRCLILSAVILPAGFFLGGIFVHSGDPNISIILVPIGAFLLFIAIVSIARGVKE